MSNTFQCDWGGRPLTIEIGKFASQADGAVTVCYGDTVVLVTACIGDLREGADFLPLTVDYEERLYAAGKIPGGFFRREGRPSQEATLTARLTDRPLRPLFPKNLRNEIQVVVTVLSTDQENEPDILAMLGASAAVGLSGIPFSGPMCATRVGYIDSQFIINPTFTQLNESKLDMIVAGTKDGVSMIEAGAKEITEDVMLEAIKVGQEVNQELIRLQEQIIQAHCKPSMEYKTKEQNEELQNEVSAFVQDRLGDKASWGSRAEREKALGKLKEELIAQLGNSHSSNEVGAAFESATKAAIRATILERGIRPDGRSLNEIRPISCEVGALPRTHGSGLFSRGQTQVLTIATLGSLREEQKIDGISQEDSKRYMHHYNFPAFSVGEVKRIGSPARREIGHGALAERALLPVIPSEEEFPYTLRLVSEVLSSNGSTSMASVCGSTLSLMDAGVPIKAPVAGIAMGLITDGEKSALLTDIEGLEDFYGDMDYKVAGTTEGITALQLDLKLKTIDFETLKKALNEALTARLFILERMRETISASRLELSKYAPRMIKISIDPEKIRNVIGPGGRTIRSITDETKVKLDVENDGTILIGSPSVEATQKAIKIIEDLTRDVEVGETYTGRVTRVTNFGAFVEILPGKEGLVHLSELADYRATSVEEVVKVGDEVMVKVIEIDRMGRVNLSRRAVFEKNSDTPGARTEAEHSGPARGRGPT
ncbi:polyribonucleotide nucleotidyltransferase, partial [Chloroflexota bacterium]